MRKKLPFILRCSLFQGIEGEELACVLACLGARTKRFNKKECILCEGEKADRIGVLLSGTAQIVQNDYYGNRHLLGNIHAGEMFAEAFVCAQVEELPVSVIATELCEVLLLDRVHILHTCDQRCAAHEQIVFNLMKELATKTILLHQKAEITAKRTTKDKLMAYLMLCARRAGGNEFVIPFDRQELADYLAVDRSGLSSEIGKLRREGVLETEKRWFRLL